MCKKEGEKERYSKRRELLRERERERRRRKGEFGISAFSMYGRIWCTNFNENGLQIGTS